MQIEENIVENDSPFFRTPAVTSTNDLAVLHLKRDSLLPVTLKETADDGYAEGAVTNTRFGSFPHSTLIGLAWGSQVRASKVDTGTRGRKAQKHQDGHEDTFEAKEADLSQPAGPSSKKRKNDGTESIPTSPVKRQKPLPTQQIERSRPRPATEAGSGFLYILPPTPESWTSSLDHRTQVVYTPDYSYILQRLRVRPGSRLIEAGAGSGSFTHAGARAVFSGYPGVSENSGSNQSGKVFSFEYHAPRVETLRRELVDHALDGVVHLTHRDVCNDGFVLTDGSSPQADAIFLDLPAPWLALKHLTRAGTTEGQTAVSSTSPPSPLNSCTPVQLCTFSPCIEQVMATVSTMRKLGWIDVEMVEMQNRRIDIRRERVGLNEEGLRGVNASPATVEEAIQRQREVDAKLNQFHENKRASRAENNEPQLNGATPNGSASAPATTTRISSKQERLQMIKKQAEERKLYKEGNLVHRTEPEVKTHTSYLVFATLPQEWSGADEAAMIEKWPVGEMMRASTKPAPDNKGSNDEKKRKKEKEKNKVIVEQN